MNTTRVTAEQVEELYDRDIHEIERGENLTTVTREDVLALMAGDVDTDDDGRPTEEMWETIADALNANEPGESTDSKQYLALQNVADTRDRLAVAEQDFHSAIRSAMATKAPRQAIADEAGLSIPRLYQICDGR